MSHDNDKVKHSTRLHKAWNAVKKQLKIAKAHGNPVDEPHRFVKQHAMDCGQPNCNLCGNPRHNRAHKGKDKLTTQERRSRQKASDE